MLAHSPSHSFLLLPPAQIPQVLQQGIIMAGESGIFTPADVAFVQSGGRLVRCTQLFSKLFTWASNAFVGGVPTLLSP